MSMTQDKTGRTETAQQPSRNFWAGRSELVVVALLLAMAIFMTIGTATMKVQGNSVPGPQFFPVLVCIVLYATAALLAVHVFRNPHVPDTDPHPGHGDFSADMLRDLAHMPEGERQTAAPGPVAANTDKTYTDWKTVGQVVAGVVGFTLILQPVGWIISAALLFWVVSRALGSRRPVFDLGVALLFASAVQLAFNAGLGLNLPSGFLGGML
ncbi:tripartite tricarboxylate transporter TctB family protein [Arthrobacter crystallopoietes]|uniref:tripartite tricarboxylate transporter TctB family protein n=1 Tax=Micrococcaceae TaxID=1268 RepID=UPI0021C5DA3E|nr:tripartite tricarboxylate transporter TctB family protein [Arthrobacter sp. Marseille-P9274]